ncbi:GNAT family N-acetyltransferase [Curtobacterium flaccumfaciens]|nr:GNAT family N-acetyltransferase [Curtobacterium flaccumfaciens]
MAVALDRFTVAGEPPPFSDQTLVDVRAGRAIVIGDERGVAVVRDGELELVVRLEARGHGLGTALVEQALAPGGGAAAPRLAWAHGDHPAARALARRFGWTAVRTLLQLRHPSRKPLRSWTSRTGTHSPRSGRAWTRRTGWRSTLLRSPTTPSRAG